MELQKSETREELLKNTINHFNSNNRGLIVFVGWDLEDMCSYINKETGNRCAIGRELPEELAVKLAENSNGAVDHHNVYIELPDRLKRMGVDFLSYIQLLHDNDENWDENGLSMEGLRFVDNIKMKFDID